MFLLPKPPKKFKKLIPKAPNGSHQTQLGNYKARQFRKNWKNKFITNLPRSWEFGNKFKIGYNYNYSYLLLINNGKP